MNPRKYIYLPLAVLAALFSSNLVFAQDLSPEAFREALDPYVGVWQGEYRIYSQNDELLNRFKINRNYWWEGTVMLGRVSYDFGEVKQTYFHRIILSDGEPFSFVTDTANSERIRSALKGEVLKGTIVWSRVLPKGGLPVRISERIVASNEGQFIEFWGNQEAKDTKGDSLLVRIEGFAAFVPDSRDLIVATEEIDEQTKEEIDEQTKEEKDEVVKDRDRRMRSLDQKTHRSSISRQETPAPSVPDPVVDGSTLAESEVVETPVILPTAELESTQPSTNQDPSLVPENTSSTKPLEADPGISDALNGLNIVGINDAEGDVCIVVDYFLLYEIGDALDMEQECVFTGLDEQYLYFEDKNGFTYRLFRKDVLSD